MRRRPEGGDIGLFHVALKIGDDLDTLRAAKAHLEACGVDIAMVADHRVSQSIYLSDPDGNQVELFVDDDPAIWREDPSTCRGHRPADALTRRLRYDPATGVAARRQGEALVAGVADLVALLAVRRRRRRRRA